MSKHRTAGILIIGVLISTLVVAAGPAGARQANDARSDHQRIVDFWTPERVQNAVPRDFVFDETSGRFVPTAPGDNGKGRPGGGGGGGGGSTSVTGASWENGGTVADATGKVLFSLSSGLYVCSATVIEDPGNNMRSLVLTAAHCVYDHAGGGEFATNWMFVPDFDSMPTNLQDGSICTSTLHGCWTASSLVVPDGFASAGAFNGTAIQYDFAVAVLETGGFESDLVETIGSQATSFASVDRGTAVGAFGYPQAAPHNGEDLRYCAGNANFDNRLFKLTYKLECDMTGGASGGGWVTNLDANGENGVVMSVNSYRYSGGSALYGPKLNANTAAIYEAALTASSYGNIVGA